MKVLVLGASGMLGNAMLRVCSERSDWELSGTVRSGTVASRLLDTCSAQLIPNVDVERPDSLADLFARLRPNVVINCIGLVKQVAESEDPLQAIPLNTLLPHRLARLCELTQSRLVHVSTDCVFSGEKGGYRESDPSDAKDLYGRSKYLGEVTYSHSITLRTSIIGHELRSPTGLIDWFLSQQQRCFGYSKAVFSGLPTVVFARIVRDVVIPRTDLSGVYHVASEPISKLELLKLVARVYEKSIEIVPDDRFIIDRSLNFERFSKVTGYVSPKWGDLVQMMFSDSKNVVNHVSK